MVLDEFTIIIPVKNEVRGLELILPELVAQFGTVVVVDDGSRDGSGDYAKKMGAEVIRHQNSKGNGAAVKAGLLIAETKYVGLMDGDGQHSVESMVSLCKEIVEKKHDLVVGTRDKSGHAGLGRRLANGFYNKFAGFMIGGRVQDLTSGQRVFLTRKIKPLIWILPNTFSYPTTSTMIFYKLGYDVGYHPIVVSKRLGESHISVLRDGFRFVLIITKIGTLYSPFKLFVPLSFGLMFLGLIRYVHTFITDGTFTNMSALLLISSVIVFLMGVISEQINMVIFKGFEGGEK